MEGATFQCNALRLTQPTVPPSACPRNALWKQRELVALLGDPQEDSQGGPPRVVMEADAGPLSGKGKFFLFACPPRPTP